MLLNTDTELNLHFPSSVIKSVRNLSMLIERAEDAHLRPVLGGSLYKDICHRYKEKLDAHQEISISSDDVATKLIALCQSAVIYFTVADNTGLLAVSLNTGGGFSVVSTDGYSPADEKEKEQLRLDCWRNAWRDIDRIIELLEEDAQSAEPVFRELWRESEWFYLQGDLLITTANEASKYLTAEEKKTFDRKRFVEMLGDLRFCQMSFISKAIGDDFLEWLVDYGVTFRPPAESEEPSSINDNVVRKTKELLSMALMAVMRYRRDHRGADDNDANLALFRATEYIKAHQHDFGRIIETSPLYVPPAADTEGENPHKPHRRKSCDCFCNGNDYSDALFIPFM